jgi:NADH-quinone oxidoreductase subunit M
MQGPLKDPEDARLRDVDRRELAVLVPVIVLMVFMGLFPGTILRKMDASVSRYINSLKSKPAVTTTLNRAGRPAPADAEAIAELERLP